MTDGADVADVAEKGLPVHSESMEKVATFCGQCQCGCPELWLDPDAPDERRVVITDDFGQRIQMSLGQLTDLVTDVKAGVLDRLTVAG